MEDDGASVYVVRDLVDGAAGFVDAAGEDGFVHAAVHEAAECGEERWVDVEEAAAPCRYEVWGDDAHVADHED